MGATQKTDLDRRLDAYFSTLRSSFLRETLKRSAGNWQIYAAVTGSAMAMVTSASASLIGSSVRDVTAEPMASVRLSRQRLASSKNIPLVRAVRLAMAKQDSVLADIRKEVNASVSQAPSIAAGGVAPVYSTANTIQPGEWVSIYGSNLASGTAYWNGDFPTSLGGTRVTINGKAAYLMYVSAGQINLQAPDDTATGTVSVVVTTAAGSAKSTVILSQFGPAFNLSDTRHVAGIILRFDGSGAYGGGAYDLLGPTGSSLGYATMAAQGGDVVELFGVGFGPTNPAVPAGAAFSGAAPIKNTLSLYINGVPVQPSFVGLASAGQYQINLTVPMGLGQGDVPIEAFIGSTETPKGMLFPLQGAITIPFPVSSGGGGGTNPGTFFGSHGGGTYPGGSFGGSGGGSGGGSDGGTGGGSSARAQPGGKPYEPRLRFTEG